MNADPKVDLDVHLGDIKAGSSSPCTDEYFAMVRGMFDTFKDPLVYTPGDNEWTDCHQASKNNGLFTPTERLQAVRALFFPVPGQTLGGRKKQVLTQADDPANSAFVENTMFMESRVVFAALNITGSNNDLASWGSPLPANAASFPTQAQEVASRAQANTAWLNSAFALANTEDAAGVVLFMQADMWDRPRRSPGSTRSSRRSGRWRPRSGNRCSSWRGLAPVQGRQSVLGDSQRGRPCLHPSPRWPKCHRMVVEERWSYGVRAPDD